MKKLLMICLATSIVYANTPEEKSDLTDKYRKKKAHEAIIHDAYYEAQKYDKELPEAWKNAVEKFGFKEADIKFWRAVRMNKFTEHVGDNIVFLWPNFLLYNTDKEQEAYVGLKLAALQAGEEFEVGGSHETFYNPKASSFQAWSLGVLGVGLAGLYHKQIAAWWPSVSKALFSKGFALIASVFAVNGARKLLEEREDIHKRREFQFAVIDKLGAEGLLSIREKQVEWGKTKASWIVRKVHYLLGKLSLVYNNEADLELIKEYIAKKEASN